MVYSIAKAERLKEAEIIVSSPYPRALQTAAILSKELGLEIMVEFDLRDYDANHGAYPPGVTKLWQSKELLKNRMENVIDKYSEFQKVIITGHGMAFRTLVGEVGEIPLASIIDYYKKRA
ncbi:histidine phosphatase family protein [Paenibacillus sp. BAC0078]